MSFLDFLKEKNIEKKVVIIPDPIPAPILEINSIKSNKVILKKMSIVEHASKILEEVSFDNSKLESKNQDVIDYAKKLL